MSSSETDDAALQAELQLFEGGGHGGSGLRHAQRPRRLSSEDVQSLIRGDGRYNRRRTSSQLSDLLASGSSRENSIRSLSFDDESSFHKKPNNRQKNDKPKLQKFVSWAEGKPVHVYHHEMILGYNTSVSSGAPVEIDWEKLDYEAQEISDKRSRPPHKMKLSSGMRHRICLASGATAVQIMQRVETIEIQRQQHMASIRKAKAEDRKAALQAKKESAKEQRRSAKQNPNQLSQSSCCIIL